MALVILPLLPLIKPDVAVDVPLFLFMCLYLGLWQQHSIFCNYIVGMNKIPCVRGYVVAAVLGVGLASLLSGALGMGARGIILGEFLSQVVYNNWKWPSYLARDLGCTYRGLVASGARAWAGRARRLLAGVRKR